MSDSTQNLVGDLMVTVNANMVTGQAPISIPSPAMNLSIDKAFTGTLSGSKYRVSQKEMYSSILGIIQKQYNVIKLFLFTHC